VDSDALYWDPYDARFAANPHPIWKRMREESPLYYNEKHDFYAITKFADVERAFTDPASFSSSRGSILELIKANIEIPPGTLIFEDPPVHDIHRKLIARVFSPRRVGALEPKVRDYAVSCLEPLVGASRFDIIETLGAEMPMKVISMLLGIPEEGQEAFRDQANAKIQTVDGGKIDTSDGVVIEHDAMSDYIDWRVDNPSDDVITELLHTPFEDENGVTRTLTPDEVKMYVTVLGGAGNETTGRLIGWMSSTLARFPGQRAELVADPSLIPGAVEETLRMEPPGPFDARYVKQDAEIAGQTIPAGSAALLVIAAANRDPERYEDPEAFNVRRKVGLHLTFAIGPHYCLGSALARLEGRIALEELLKRWPTWEIDWDDAKLQQTSTVRGWERLPLVVG
jgi:cytochrome P450